MFSLSRNFLKFAAAGAFAALTVSGTPTCADEMAQNLGPMGPWSPHGSGITSADSTSRQSVPLEIVNSEGGGNLATATAGQSGLATTGDVSNMQIDDIVAKVVSKVPDAQVMGDLDAAARWATGHGGGGKLGVTGFCWGGRIVWMYAAHSPDLAAGVAWYGGVANGRYPGDKGAIEVVDRIKAPILGLYGGADPGIPNDSVERMRAALKAAGNTRSEIISYPDTPHAFHADYRPSYRKAAAEDGWKRLTAWFRQHLA